MLELSDRHLKADKIITFEMNERIERLSQEIESPSKGTEDAKKTKKKQTKKHRKEIFLCLFLFLLKIFLLKYN